MLPIKSLAPMAFHERDQPDPPPPPPPLAAAHLALPDASLVRTYPLDAHERILRPWKVPVPTTSSFEVGVEVPIPICHPERIVTFAASFGPIIVDPITELEIE